MTKSTDHFLSLKENPNIKYEKRVEQYTHLISEYLAEAIALVETKQYGLFPENVIVYIPE